MVDSMFLQSTISTTLATGGHSVQLLFAFEYIILASTIIATFLKYIFSMVDSYMEVGNMHELHQCPGACNTCTCTMSALS